jgi:lipoyl(octanoyl) transferase
LLAQPNKSIQILDWGKISYKEAWEAQTKLFEEIIAIKLNNRNNPNDSIHKTPNYLVFCEHPPVFTLGKSGKVNHLLLSEDELDKHEIEYFHINRGGDITYHGPGQMVVYPILDLDNFFTDIHRYMRLLEECIIKTLETFGVKAHRIETLTGVWLQNNPAETPRKIAALGVKLSRWVSMHGLALNVNTDLSYFNHIVPCGISDRAVTSMQKELGKEIKIENVKQTFLRFFAEIFETSIEA